ncbi:MAG: hypothetical protein QOG19_3342, partial [Mycobacterium sp.]|nr:hypothetical protein [Mycobacterium sp.]
MAAFEVVDVLGHGDGELDGGGPAPVEGVQGPG